MDYTVTQTPEGFIIKVRVPERTVNEWNLGFNEEVAQSKAATIVETYRKGLEFVQDQVRSVFSEQEDAIEQS